MSINTSRRRTVSTYLIVTDTTRTKFNLFNKVEYNKRERENWGNLCLYREIRAKQKKQKKKIVGS